MDLPHGKAGRRVAEPVAKRACPKPSEATFGFAKGL